MATNPQEAAQGGEENPELNTDPQPNTAPADGGEGEGGEENNEPGPYDALAREMGWVPQADFKGDPEQWRDAETFIRTGREIQRDTARELKALRSTVDTIGKTTATVIQQEVDRKVAELSREHAQAVEDGDSKRAFDISQDIIKVSQTAKPTNQPSAEAAAFAARNDKWFQKDPLATSLAIDVTNRLATMGYDQATQLEYAEKEVRRQYPHLFGKEGLNGGKPAPGVNAPGQRAPVGNNNKPKGFADMPAESQKVANEMASRGVGGADIDAFKKRFAENYWLQEKAKA